MEAMLSLKYDREADILYINKCAPYAEQESEELGEEVIARIETDLIEQAMRNAKYSQKRAAKLLGLTTRSLRYRLQKYGFDSQ